jgi:hypothetical protein
MTEPIKRFFLCECGEIWTTFETINQYCKKYEDHKHIWKQVFHCPDCNSILGEAIDGIFIRTRADGIETGGKDHWIILHCHNKCKRKLKLTKTYKENNTFNIEIIE